MDFYSTELLTLTTAEKEEKSRKLREQRAMDPSAKEKILKEHRGRRTVIKEKKKRWLDLQEEIQAAREETIEERMERTVQNLRKDREDNVDLLRAMNALDLAEIIPMMKRKKNGPIDKEYILAERKRAGVPRTHRAACKAIVSENRFTMHYCGEVNLICQKCGAKHFKAERPTD